jgi:DNA repair protein RecN (Recombination protein N)
MALRELTVENLAVVERVRLELDPGFTVLTGETGAGKSLVVDAVALALGARASTDQVRAGADAARVEAIFDAPPLDADDPMAELVAAGEGTLIVRREVGADGRSVARLNDRAVTVGGLAAVGSRLGEIHGQHDQQRLLDPAHQLALLDGFAAHPELVAAVAEAHRAWRATMAAATELLTDAHELARRVELLRHQADEIGAAMPRVGEDVELEHQLRAAEHAEVIARAADAAVRALRDDGGAGDALSVAERELLTAAAHDDRFAPLADRAAGLAAEAGELARDAAAAGEAVDLDPASRATAEERLTHLYDLRRKYGDSLDAVIAFGAAAADELERLEDQEGERARLRDEEASRRASLEALAADLSDARRASADRLVIAVNAELPPLGLPAGAFGVEVDTVEIGPAGADRVTFTFAPNPGEPPRPLGRIASGGEASRLSLALKVVLAASDATPLLVFDEVDAGVGGRNASAVGERLRELSRFHQVLCVTHLPQVAAHADSHLVVGKRVVGERTVTEAILLDPEARTAELAAMLGGEGAGAEAHSTAEALLRRAGGR